MDAREEIVFTVRPKIHSHSQIFRYGQSIFCLPHRPNFSDIFDVCPHWVSVVRGRYVIYKTFILEGMGKMKIKEIPCENNKDAFLKIISSHCA